jgi:tetratricopeptide (TPR) repeat protein
MAKPSRKTTASAIPLHPSNALHPIVSFLQSARNASFALFLFCFLLYGNTLNHGFTQDDAIVITDNMFTQQGFQGIPGILKYDTFFGFFKEEGKANLVAGGRYRPFTLIIFALEYELFGLSPFAAHLLTIVWYAACVIVLYLCLLVLLKIRLGETSALVAFSAALLFAAHPIHTEAVANIKGRDEIICLFLSLLSLRFVLKGLDSQKVYWYFLAGITFFLGLLSKENAITFMAIIPLAIIFFRKFEWKSAIIPLGILTVTTFIFLIIRAQVLGQWFGSEPPMELLNNPFLKLVGDTFVPMTFSEKMATITYTLGRYVQLLLFPHPLTHDYYPRHIAMMSWTHPGVLVSLALYIAMAAFIVLKWKSRSVYAFCLIYFIATLSIVSNLFFPVGTNMSERFLFMPSVGFALLTAYWMITEMWNKGKQTLFFGMLGIILTLYSLKTITRNNVWESNSKLFISDVEISDNSAKLLNAAGAEKLVLANNETDPAKKAEWIKAAKEHLEKAISIHPQYLNAWLLLGNAYFYNEEYDKAIESYLKTLAINPNYQDALGNLGKAYREGGKMYGEKQGNVEKALQYLNEALRYLPDDYETLRLLGVANGVSGNHTLAIEYFEKATIAEPDLADAWLNLGTAYFSAGDIEKGNYFYAKAKEMDPAVLDRNQRK